jgi:hypothetical protein
MNIDQAIAALTEARAEVGGAAPLLMADGLHVVKLPGGNGCVYVSDRPLPEGEAESIVREALDLPPSE